MSASVIISIFALAVAVFALQNSLKQRKIASEAHRLNLYQRRFHVFDQGISFYLKFARVHALGQRWAQPKFEEEASEFASSINEAVFLFNPDDGVAVTMRKLLEQVDLTNNGRGTDMDTVSVHVDALWSKMAPYLNFHSIAADPSEGWCDRTISATKQFLTRI